KQEQADEVLKERDDPGRNIVRSLAECAHHSDAKKRNDDQKATESSVFCVWRLDGRRSGHKCICRPEINLSSRAKSLRRDDAVEGPAFNSCRLFQPFQKMVAHAQ